MGMSERAVHINNLVALKDFCNNNGVFTLASNIEQSLDYAILSIKTDEAYQIMYEGGEIFTKDEVEKAIGEVEEYICDVETDTVKAQGMAQALDIFEQALRGEEDE